jgi:hypothetical protein
MSFTDMIDALPIMIWHERVNADSQKQPDKCRRFCDKEAQTRFSPFRYDSEARIPREGQI